MFRGRGFLFLVAKLLSLFPIWGSGIQLFLRVLRQFFYFYRYWKVAREWIIICPWFLAIVGCWAVRFSSSPYVWIGGLSIVSMGPTIWGVEERKFDSFQKHFSVYLELKIVQIPDTAKYSMDGHAWVVLFSFLFFFFFFFWGTVAWYDCL